MTLSLLYIRWTSHCKKAEKRFSWKWSIPVYASEPLALNLTKIFFFLLLVIVEIQSLKHGTWVIPIRYSSYCSNNKLFTYEINDLSNYTQSFKFKVNKAPLCTWHLTIFRNSFRRSQLSDICTHKSHIESKKSPNASSCFSLGLSWPTLHIYSRVICYAESLRYCRTKCDIDVLVIRYTKVWK